MNREERQLVDDLFERLSKLENSPRDPDALAAIAQGLSRAPNAVYALVQTVLVQDEALKRANARIEELEQVAAPAPQEQQGGFLDNMRSAILGQPSRGGSVPNVRAGAGGDRPVWNSAPGYQTDPRQADPRMAPPAPPPPQQGGGGGSFLGTAAAAAAGVIGGSLLMNSIGGLMGGAKHGFGDASSAGKDSGGSNPWSGGGGDQSKGDLAREAGVNDIGRSGQSASDSGSRQGMFDQASNENYGDDDEDEDDYDSDDFDGGDSDSDFA
jgi:hypothetical protein